jgi:hypothetical protein
MFFITPVENPQVFDADIYQRTLGEFIILRNGAPVLDSGTLKSRGACLAWAGQMELVRVSQYSFTWKHPDWLSELSIPSLHPSIGWRCPHTRLASEGVGRDCVSH